MITMFENKKNHLGEVCTIYDTSKATYARKTRSLCKEFGCGSDELKKFRDENKHVKPLTVNELIEFLNTLPGNTVVAYHHDSGILDDVMSIETRFTEGESGCVTLY